MKKIAKTIATCHDCDHCKVLHSKDNNYGKAFVCVFFDENSELPSPNPFLLEYTENSGNPGLQIPKECPLEDYNP